MKYSSPEISWHNRDPVLSVDIQRSSTNFYRLASGGTDSHVLIWHIVIEENGNSRIEFASDLSRHQKAVNCVRFAPTEEYLASGDDEASIILWKPKTEADFPEDNDEGFKEQWLVWKVLRGHLDDIYDLSWAPNSKQLISGSVDNTAVVWDVEKGQKIASLGEHKSFVQGVAWDPKNKLAATLSSDRVMRVYNLATRRVVNRAYKSKLSVPENHPMEGNVQRLFHDDTLKSFFRRLTFSPDGELLIAPAGILEPAQQGEKRVNTTLVFTRNNLSRPVLYFPTFNQYTVAVRCCPVLFQLRDMSGGAPVFALPYRIVIAVATQKSVLLYDTQHASPFAFIANIHFTRLTDLTWSSDGKILVISSTDGYCSIITFADNELGIPFVQGEDESGVEKKMSVA
ncbi:unnamed protein product [Bemisia tabaci]|uniref:CAF1B/HIR1 beta-propeller domain-containing protein n=1 Tax=Bemisia tabaci TaxID=7038 RepID=A0A9P0F045_BEMTA|nr:PREDICTED: chromatin assembly factor 1 subunit B [Bemisia tabaci]CAH0386297.1 unnamed protein product [Bemisia tabaci]